jgi:hypothetical protein
VTAAKDKGKFYFKKKIKITKFFLVSEAVGQAKEKGKRKNTNALK